MRRPIMAALLLALLLPMTAGADLTERERAAVDSALVKTRVLVTLADQLASDGLTDKSRADAIEAAEKVRRVEQLLVDIMKEDR